MSRSCLLALVVIVTMGIVAVPRITKAQTKSSSSEAMSGKEDVVKKLDYLEAWSTGKTVPSNVQIDEVLADLKKNPEGAMPLLAEAFTDSGRDQRFRINVGQILREIVKPIPTKYDGRLEKVIRDSAEPPSIRIYAAHLRLAPGKDVPAPVKNSILDMGDKFLHEGKDDGNLRLLVFARLTGSERAGQIMIRELQHGKDVDATLWVLGKIKTQTAVAPISNILAKQQSANGATSTKVRSYLALGEIGGSKSYDLLNTCLVKEKDEERRRVIVLAMGVTRDPRAKDFLLDYLLHKPATYYVTALDGLRYLGDPSVIPVLENELTKPLEQFERFRVRSAIDSIKQGPARPEW